MPIYEFYCPDCHTVFSFLARSTSTRRRPDCPKCGRPRLARRPSTFAVSRGLDESAADESGLPADFDEARVERAMAEIASEAESVSEDDPRAMARLMRRFQETTGLSLGPGIEEAMARMEAGEDPERIEEEMGDLLDEDGEPSVEPTAAGRLRALARRARPGRGDPGLYDL